MENTYCNNIDCCNIDLITLYYIYLTQKHVLHLRWHLGLKIFNIHIVKEKLTFRNTWSWLWTMCGISIKRDQKRLLEQTDIFTTTDKICMQYLIEWNSFMLKRITFKVSLYKLQFFIFLFMLSVACCTVPNFKEGWISVFGKFQPQANFIRVRTFFYHSRFLFGPTNYHKM